MRMRRQLFRSHTPNSPIARLGALAEYILGQKALSACFLLCIPNWFELVNGPFGQSNMI